MAALPSTAALELDLARLSLASPYQGQQYAQPIYLQPQPQGQPSQLDRASLGAQVPADGTAASLQPHQIMQPPLHQGPPPHVQLKEPQRRRGVVKFFNSLKGFGFVVDNDPAALGGQEVFCHFSAIAGKAGFRSLAEGEEVEYELVQGPKGFQAANLTGPGGRTVVGDPKARMQKPPAYLPLAPYALPIGAPYLADPYHAQAAGVYAGSPYTQHVLYVPASAALPPSQYAYAPVPLAAQPLGRHAAQPSGASGSPFVAPQYQSYAAPPSLLAGAPSAGSDRYGALGRNGAPGAYGATQQPGATDTPRSSSYAGGAGPLPGPGFSPPGGFVGLPGSPQLGPGPGPGPSFGGFAPFSPPSFNHAPLFGAPHPMAPPLDGAFASYATTPSNGTPGPGQRAPQSSAAGATGAVTTPSSALFGTTPAPIGSRSGTPAAGGRSTPALGNGSLGSDAWKATPAGAGVLYAGAGSNGASPEVQL